MADQYGLGFSISNLGPKSFQKILNNFESLEKGWNGTKEEFENLEIGGKTLATFDNFRKTFDFVQYTVRMEKAGVEFISFLDKEYPAKLKKLENPPIGIFVKGNIKLLKSDFSIAVVGTRKATSYGREVTEFLVNKLANNNVCIISGLALGIDGIAHRETVLQKGKTIAVLACGVDCCLPAENYSLYRSILENNGLVISEYPLSQPPNKGTFLARNRIIAALSDGVLVTEAAEGSGSLVTAGFGLQLSKKVFAVPGPITSRMSDGGLKLLKQGAKLVSNAKDILEEFPSASRRTKNKSRNFKNLNKDEIKILKLLENEEMTVDEIMKITKLKISNLFGLLSNLELKGIVKNKSGKICMASEQY